MNEMNFPLHSAAIPADGGTLLRVQERNAVPLLLQYWRIAVRWRWAIAAAIALSILVGVAATLLMTRQYTASVTLEIAREDVRIVNIEDVQPKAGSLDQEFYQTQYGLLKSHSLAERVARRLRLVDDANFFKLYGEVPKSGMPGESAQANTPAARAERLREATSLLLDNLSVSPERNSRLVTVSFVSPDPAFSAQVANAWAENFIESNLERRFQASAYARQFLEQRLNETRLRLDESERRLVAYAARQRIINVATPQGGKENSQTVAERSLLADDVATLNENLSLAKAERVRAEAKWQEARSGRPPVDALANLTITALRQKRGEAAAEHARLLSQFQPTYPPVIAAKAQVDQFDQSISREEGRVRQIAETQYREAVAREAALSRRVEGLKSDLLDLRRRTIQYNIFQRDVDTNRSLYDGLLQRYKEIGIAGGIGSNNVSVVDRAEIPEKPSRPRPFLNLLLATFIGTLLGGALALALEQIDEVISDPDDLERTLGLPMLGAVPKLTDRTPIDALEDRKSELSEAYLSVQTNLQFSTAEGVPSTLMLTSTRPAEGKSTSAFAVARSLARLNRRTLLIDADMRSPSMHHMLDLSNEKGLSNLLSGNAELGEAVRSTGIENLWTVTSGPTPPNAAELLSSGRLSEVLEQATRAFDNVVIDAPPVMGLADAPLLASNVGGTIFVVESRGMRSRLIKIALGRLQNAQTRILGAVLTKFESKRAHFGYGYDYGYGYGRSERVKA